MEALHECSICKDEMRAPAFDANSDEGICGGDCFRLPCRHAFHTHCLVTSLRSSGTGCPVCRDGSSDEVVIRREGRALVYLDMELDNDEDEDEDENEFLTRVIASLECSNARVIAAKRSLNAAIKTYNIFRDKLRCERKRAIHCAMREFRNRRYHEFVTVRGRVSDALKTYQSLLRQEIGVSGDDIAFPSADEFLRQPVHALSSVRRQDPMRLSFWH